MAQHETRFDLGLLDVWTFQFRKKVCSRCGERLVRKKRAESTGRRMQWEVDGLTLRGWYGDRTYLTFLYVCRSCRLRWTLGQLRRGESGLPIPATENLDWHQLV